MTRVRLSRTQHYLDNYLRIGQAQPGEYGTRRFDSNDQSSGPWEAIIQNLYNNPSTGVYIGCTDLALMFIDDGLRYLPVYLDADTSDRIGERLFRRACCVKQIGIGFDS